MTYTYILIIKCWAKQNKRKKRANFFFFFRECTIINCWTIRLKPQALSLVHLNFLYLSLCHPVSSLLFSSTPFLVKERIMKGIRKNNKEVSEILKCKGCNSKLITCCSNYEHLSPNFYICNWSPLTTTTTTNTTIVLSRLWNRGAGRRKRGWDDSILF